MANAMILGLLRCGRAFAVLFWRGCEGWVFSGKDNRWRARQNGRCPRSWSVL